MLHEKYLPEFHFSEKHSTTIRQSPDIIDKVVNDFDFSSSFLIRTLLRLRALTSGATLKQGLLQKSFIQLEYIPQREMILGLVGQFWKPSGNLQSLSREEFVTFKQPGFLKATWNFEMKLKPSGYTLLETETRVQCMDEKAYKRFSRYWIFVRPFSGLIRREMLRAVKKKAEKIPIVN